MITYLDSPANLTAEQLQGFFVGWPSPPSSATLLRILQGSAHVVLAFDEALQTVVGYITAISDGVSCAYIPHLEVRPDFQNQGIGSALVRRMLEKLRNLYMVDLICDADLQPFYAKQGMIPYTGMILRNHGRQNCA